MEQWHGELTCSSYIDGSMLKDGQFHPVRGAYIYCYINGKAIGSAQGVRILREGQTDNGRVEIDLNRNGYSILDQISSEEIYELLFVVEDDRSPFAEFELKDAKFDSVDNGRPFTFYGTLGVL